MKEKMRQLTIKLSEQEMDWVEEQALRDLREPAMQVRYLLIGLIEAEENKSRQQFREIFRGEVRDEEVQGMRKTDGQGEGHDARQVQGQVEVE